MPERLIAERVIKRLAREFIYHFDVEPYLWEREPLVASAPFQKLIVEPRKTDIVLVILWSRLGVILGDPDYLGPLSKKPVTGTEWEFEDALQAAQVNGRPDLFLYRKTAPIPAVDLKDREAIAESIRQDDLVEAFMARWTRDATGKSFTAAYREFTDGASFESLLYDHLRSKLREYITRERDQPRTKIWHEPPYRGLEPFGPEHEQIFFGRTRARNELRELFTAKVTAGCPFMLVMGASGCGKSSLVAAGLVPEIAEPGMIGRTALVRCAFSRPLLAPAAPTRGLAGAMLAPGGLPELAAPPLVYDVGSLAEQLAQSSVSVMQAVRQGLSAASLAQQLKGGGEARLLLVIDQFEELFTTEGVSAKDRQVYVGALDALVRSGLVWVIASMRSDFFHRLDELPKLKSLSEGGRYLLSPPEGEEIAQIIREPAGQAGLEFEVDERTGQSLDELVRREAEANPGSLPLLEYLLDQLWRRADGGRLTFAAYDDLNGLKGAIGARAEQVVDGLELGAAEKKALPRVVRALASVGQGAAGAITARRAALSAFALGSPERRLIDAFSAADARLVVVDGDTVRVAHEALLSHWTWAAEQLVNDRRDLQLRGRLEEAQARWATEKNPGDKASLVIPPGLPLSEAADWLARQRSEIAPELIDYIEHSIAVEATGRRRATRRLQAVAAGLAILAAVALAGGWFGIRGERLAVEQARVAEEKERIAVAARIEADKQAKAAEESSLAAAKAREIARERRDAALREQSLYLARESRRHLENGSAVTATRLALEALPRSLVEFDRRPIVPEAQSALMRAGQADALRAMHSVHAGSIWRTVLSADGTIALALTGQGHASLFDVATGRSIKSWSGLEFGEFYGPVLARDGRRVIVRHWDKLRIHDVRSGKALELGAGKVTYTAATFSDDGTRVAAIGRDGFVRLWNATSGGELGSAPIAKNSVGVVTSGDGSRTAVLGPTGQLWLYAENLQDPRTLAADVSSMAFSPDGELIAAGSETGDITLFEMRSGRVATPLQGHFDRVTTLVFSDDGHRLVSASDDRTARVWDLRNRRAQVVFGAHASPIVDLAVGGQDSLVASADSDSVRVWRLDDGREVSRFGLAPESIKSVALSRGGERLVVADKDTAWLFDPAPQAARRPVEILVDRGAEPHRSYHDPWTQLQIAMSGDRHWLALTTPAAPGQIWLNDQLGRGASRTIEVPGSVLTQVKFAADGASFLTGEVEGYARLWNTAKGAEIWRTPRLESSIEKIDLSSNGRYALTVNGDLRHGTVRDERLSGPVRIWDRETGNLVHEFRGHQREPTAARFIGMGDLVASADRAGGKVLLWQASTGRIEREFVLPTEKHTGNKPVVYHLAATEDGKQIVAYYSAGTLYPGGWAVLSVAHGAVEEIETLGKAFWTSIEHRPGSRQFAIASNGGVVLATDAERARRIWLTNVPEANAISYSRDGGLIAVGTKKGEVYVLDAESGHVLVSFAAHADEVRGVAVDADSRHLLSAGIDGRLQRRRLPITGQDAIDLARARIPHPFSRTQRIALGLPIETSDRPGSRPLPEDAVGRCDALAASPFDRDKRGPGVGWSKLDAQAAAAACNEAVRSDPNAARLVYQLARATEKAGRDSEAVRLYVAAAKAGHTAAKVDAGIAFLLGDGVPVDQAEGLRWLHEATAVGDARAQWFLGKAFSEGMAGLTIDRRAALSWWQKSAAQNFVYGQLSLADALSDANAPGSDLEQAMYWYAMAEQVAARLPAGYGEQLWSARDRRATLAIGLPAEAALRAWRKAASDGQQMLRAGTGSER